MKNKLYEMFRIIFNEKYFYTDYSGLHQFGDEGDLVIFNPNVNIFGIGHGWNLQIYDLKTQEFLGWNSDKLPEAGNKWFKFYLNKHEIGADNTILLYNYDGQVIKFVREIKSNKDFKILEYNNKDYCIIKFLLGRKIIGRDFKFKYYKLYPNGKIVKIKSDDSN